MTDPRFMSTGELIRYAMSQFKAERRERFIHAGGRGRRVHGPGERVLYLPNGSQVKVSVDDSGHATQVEEADHLHGIARPDAIQASFAIRHADAGGSSRARPRPIKTTFIPRRNT